MNTLADVPFLFYISAVSLDEGNLQYDENRRNVLAQHRPLRHPVSPSSPKLRSVILSNDIKHYPLLLLLYIFAILLMPKDINDHVWG